jgi:exodeoxyribonuclease VII small subunit
LTLLVPIPDVASLSYEQARDELVGVVRALEAGNVPLEESLTLWERGEALAARCQQWLDGARERLAAARNETDGSSAPAGDDALAGSDSAEDVER